MSRTRKDRIASIAGTYNSYNPCNRSLTPTDHERPVEVSIRDPFLDVRSNTPLMTYLETYSMNITFRLVIGVGIACLLGLTAPNSAAATLPTRVYSPNSGFDWEFPGEYEILGVPELHLLDLGRLLEPPPRNSYPAFTPQAAVPEAAPAAGIRNAADGTWVTPGRAVFPGSAVGHPPRVSFTEYAVAEPIAPSGVEAELISVWLPQLVQEWAGNTSLAAMPWAAIGAGSLILIVLARMLRPRPTAKRKPQSHTRQTSNLTRSVRHVSQGSPVSSKLKLHPATTSGEADGNGEAELEDWIVEGADSAADHALRDKSEERRQLESWRKLSQVASKAFILKEEEEAAKQNALWLSLVAVALGVSGLGIIATAAVGPYSLLCGVCLAGMSLVMLSWSGVKVVFHQLRRWILLRPVRG